MNFDENKLSDPTLLKNLQKAVLKKKYSGENNQLLKIKPKVSENIRKIRRESKLRSKVMKELENVKGSNPAFPFENLNFEEGQMGNFGVDLDLKDGTRSLSQGSSGWNSVYKYIADKYTNRLPIKDMLQQRMIKERIY
jgi:hypothetical protein